MNIINLFKKNRKYRKNYFLIFSLFISSCQINPATGINEITLMNNKEEKLIGKEEHLKIIKQYGGEYKNIKLQNYINSIGIFLVSTSELPNLKFTFTLLDSPIVNAFALPGGYIYITRGLLSICQNEAQLAGVLAHEIGHVTARHAANRYTKSVGIGVLSNILSVIGKNRVLSSVINQSSGLYLLSYSRKQEYEADKLSVRYMTRAGFEPREMSNFLRIMEEYSILQNKIIGHNDKNSKSDLLLTHPSSSKRILQVINESKIKPVSNPIVAKEIFLKKIDGLNFGEKIEEGIIKGNYFFHPKLKISFKLTEKFYFINTPKNLLGVSKGDAKIIFDIDNKTIRIDKLRDYLEKWSGGSKLSKYKESSISGLKMAEAILKINGKDIKISVIRNNSILYRFMLISGGENNFNSYNEELSKTLESFDIKNSEYIERILPNKIKIISVKSTDTIDSLQKRQSIQRKYSKDIFILINNIKEKIIPGQKVKIIANN